MAIAIAACAALASFWISAAVAKTFEDLEGKSIVYDHHERNGYQSGNLADVMWNRRIYIAPGGRVFLRHRTTAHFGFHSSESTRFGLDGERDGSGNGRHANFRRDGNGFTRSWDSGGVKRECDPGTLLGHFGSSRIVCGNALH